MTTPAVPVMRLLPVTRNAPPRWTYPVAAPKSSVGPLKVSPNGDWLAETTAPLYTLRVPAPVTVAAPVAARLLTRVAPATVAVAVARLAFW